MNGTLASRDDESAAKRGAMGCKGRKIENMISFIQLRRRGDRTGVQRHTRTSSSLLAKEASIDACGKSTPT